ncbi:uncharacterized protein EAF01_004882 [Botrytis porri]|uniref:uncharacterized protein n=1 Tax=Botrytis porri TaxID=87229 RepID=UPI001900FC90|nr:uncharacterized protein EAF01_004882 [Botrytis porri]KAF7907295.1 hypothetical protein EAF01_004882 [Botrytis porri]
MTDSDLSNFIHDLRTILTEMRKIHNPHGLQAEVRLCGAKGNTPCHDFRLGDSCGPFPTLDSFQQHLRTNAYVSSPPNPTTDLDVPTQKCLLVHTPPRSIFFAHGDPNLNNILINPFSFRISELVDCMPGDAFWKSLLQRVIPGFEEEVKTKIWLWDRSDPF